MPLRAANGAAPHTVARVPKAGEVFYSENGSPLGIFDDEEGAASGPLDFGSPPEAAQAACLTVKKTGRKGKRGADDQISVTIKTDKGDIDLSQVKGADQSLLLGIQSQLASVLSMFSHKAG